MTRYCFSCFRELPSSMKAAVWRRHPTALAEHPEFSPDGISQPDELMPVTDSSLTAISLNDHWTGRRDVSGNDFRYKAEVTIQAVANRPTPRPVYDVFFTRVR